MPKATKKKKEKQADFTKAKLKLGKGKKAPSNATDTSFKARSIALPGQQVLNRALATAEGSTPLEPTTAQGLTLDDVVVRLRHPNAGVKRDALSGLREILAIDPGREVGKSLRALGGLVADEDGTVRKALIGVLAWYLEQVPESILSPHLALLVLQVSSALSHIFPEIRLDACRLVQLLLTHVPAHVVASWPRESSNILEGLRLAVGLGGEKGVNTQIGRLVGGAKLVTLRAMKEFVRAGLGAGAEEGLDVFDGWREGKGAVQQGKGKGKMKEIADLPDLMEGWFVGSAGEGLLAGSSSGSGSDWELGRMGNQADMNATEDNVVGVISQLYKQLHPLLLSTFLESAPTAFSPSQTSAPSSSTTTTEDTHLALCTTSASLAGLLARAILARSSSPEIASSASAELKEVKSCISDFLKRMAGWFPFHTPRTGAANPSGSGIPAAFELCLVYAELAVRLAPSPPRLVVPAQSSSRKDESWRARVKAVQVAWGVMREQERKAKTKGKGKAGAADFWAMEEVAEWIVDILAPNQDALKQPISAAAYTALLPIIWALLVRPPPPHTQPGSEPESTNTSSEIGVALLGHLSRQASTSQIRSIGDGFVVSLIGVHEQRYPVLPFYIPPESGLEMRSLVNAWVENVPKTLWELGNRDELASERLLRFLLDLGARGKAGIEQPYSLITPQAYESIPAKLAPFFHLMHPTKGAMLGPWIRLSAAVKKLALDVAAVWVGEAGVEGGRGGEGGEGRRRLKEAVGRAVRGQEVHGYWSRLNV